MSDTHAVITRNEGSHQTCVTWCGIPPCVGMTNYTQSCHRGMKLRQAQAPGMMYFWCAFGRLPSTSSGTGLRKLLLYGLCLRYCFFGGVLCVCRVVVLRKLWRG